ncbi:MAG: rhomboid family intramembrane serine protease [Lachnospirales bacterium]
MFLNFAKQFYQDLLTAGYSTINQEYENAMLTKDTAFLAVEKAFGPNLFIVLIHNSINHPQEYNFLITSQLSRQINTSSMVMRFKQVIILNLFVTEDKNIKDDIEKFIDTCSGEGTSFIYNVYWNIHIDKEKESFNVYTGEKQPSKILDVDKIINNSFENIYFSESKPISLKVISAKAEENTKIKLVTNDALITYIISFFLIIFHFLTIGHQSDYYLTANAISSGEYFRLVSAIFVHSDIFHLFNNVLWIIIFGVRVERYMGKLNFLAIFFISGIVGNVFSLLLLDVNSLGASGAGLGLSGALLVMLFYAKREIDNFGYPLVLVYSIMSIGMGFVYPNVNNVAHIFGFLTGIALGYAHMNILKVKEEIK